MRPVFYGKPGAFIYIGLEMPMGLTLPDASLAIKVKAAIVTTVGAPQLKACLLMDRKAKLGLLLETSIKYNRQIVIKSGQVI